MTTEATPGALGSNDQVGVMENLRAILGELDQDIRYLRRRLSALCPPNDGCFETCSNAASRVELLLRTNTIENTERFDRLAAETKQLRLALRCMLRDAPKFNDGTQAVKRARALLNAPVADYYK